MRPVILVEVLLADEAVVTHDEVLPPGQLAAALAAAEAGHVEQVVVGPPHPVVLLQLNVALDAARQLPLGLLAEQPAWSGEHRCVRVVEAGQPVRSSKHTGVVGGRVGQQV